MKLDLSVARSLAVATALLCLVLAGGVGKEAAAQARPEGEMRWALYVTLSPMWFDPGEFAGLTPFWVLYAIHDALVKPMPGNLMGETIIGYLGAVGIKLKMRPMERASYTTALMAKKLRGVCVCATAIYGNAASRMSEVIPSTGTFAYGGYPDIDALYKEQALVTDRRKREAMLHQIQQQVHERVRFAPIWEYIWPSAVGPRVEEPALMLINPYPWSAPLEEVRLKKK